MRIGSLFSGYGGLDMGVTAALGGSVAWHVEFDKAPSKILAHHWPDVPNYGDVTAVDWSAVEPVDVLTAGFPCQPVSKAGKRLGDLDERWLWDDVVRAVGALRPGLLVLENVRGLFTAGGGGLFGRVLGTLADLRYDVRWHGLPASGVGAPHERFRVFFAAYPRGERHGTREVAGSVGRLDGEAQGRARERERPRAVTGGGTHQVPVSDPVRARPQGLSDGAGYPWAPAAGSDQGAFDWRQYSHAVSRWERVLGRRAPAPAIDGKENPAFVEWMMGLPAGHVTHPDIGLSWPSQLKALGNGVVPQQAEAAIRYLLSVQAVAA